MALSGDCTKGTWASRVLAALSFSVMTGSFAQQPVANLDPVPVGYWDGVPTVSIADLRAAVAQDNALEASNEKDYLDRMAACNASAQPQGATAPPPSTSPGTAPAASGDMTTLSDEELRARLATGNMAAIQELRRRTMARAFGNSGVSPEAADRASRQPSAPPAGAGPAPAAPGGLFGGLVAQAMGTAVRTGSDPRAAACSAEQKKKPISQKIPPLGYSLARNLIAKFDRAGNPRGFSAVLYAGGTAGGQGPINVVDPDGPWKSRVEDFDSALKRAMDYDSGMQTRPAGEAERMLRPLQPIRKAGDNYVAPAVPPPPVASAGVPPPAPIGSYKLGSVDLNTTALITKSVDKSHGFSYINDVFRYQKPAFSSDAARKLYEQSIDQPMDPAYYADHQWKSNFDANVVKYQQEIEALPKPDQAQLLANMMLWVRAEPGFGEGGALRLFRRFPQIQDIEFAWMRPRKDSNGQTLANHGEILRGSVFDFLTSDVQAGTPNEMHEYPFLASAIPSGNLMSFRQSPAKGR